MKVIRIIKKASDIPIKSGFTPKWGTGHCTSGPQNQSTQEIFNYWKKKNGWSNVGYHFMINKDGTIEQCKEIWESTNGVKDYNTRNIHFTYKGGIDSKGNPVDNRTEAQIKSQLLIIDFLKTNYPNIIIMGHRDFSTDKNGNGILERWEWIKSCPSYDVRDDLSKRGKNDVIVPSKIVYKLNEPLIKNDTVRSIQRSLGIKEDGWFGLNTDKAVKMFQFNNGLIADGIVGVKTAELLKVKI